MGKCLHRSIIYNILRDGDRHLRGRIAELVFERVADQLSKKLQCCSTHELTYFFGLYNYYFQHFLSELHLPDISVIDDKQLISGYIKKLEAVRRLFKLEGRKASEIISRENTRKNLERLCPICLKDRGIEIKVSIGKETIRLYLCRNCLKKIIEKKVVRKVSENFYEINQVDKKSFDLILDLVKLTEIMKHTNIIKIISKFDPDSRLFLYYIYIGADRGHFPFDYICVDEEGNKYMVDVTSVIGLDRTPAKLSDRERRIAETAREKGFKVMIPVIRFLNDWRVKVELMEINFSRDLYESPKTKPREDMIV
jgi:hypothetical protein